ncbi:rhodanese-like domain-containing protein [Alphaproteobacteria bacterium]|nr:rhodanese-like domain-containing protein [Alphaproteobacteria bacterium]
MIEVYGYKKLIKDAENEIETLSIEEVLKSIENNDSILVDIRDIRELWREGKITTAIHAPRGMLEFWVDPESPYHKDVFSKDKKYIFYCQSGWRSALATQTVQKMGLKPVAHMGGGFSEWKKSGLEIEKVIPNKK